MHAAVSKLAGFAKDTFVQLSRNPDSTALFLAARYQQAHATNVRESEILAQLSSLVRDRLATISCRNPVRYRVTAAAAGQGSNAPSKSAGGDTAHAGAGKTLHQPAAAAVAAAAPAASAKKATTASRHAHGETRAANESVVIRTLVSNGVGLKSFLGVEEIAARTQLPDRVVLGILHSNKSTGTVHHLQGGDQVVVTSHNDQHYQYSGPAAKQGTRWGVLLVPQLA